MLKNILVLADGTEISSGVGTVNAIQSTKVTQSVNTGEELTLGSTCAAILEMTLFTPGGNLPLTAGDRVTLYKEREDGERSKVGVFILEQPTRPSANTVSLIGYDPVIGLDKDLTQWLGGLDGWPYSLLEFAQMVCGACGLHMVTTQIPNGDFFVPQFTLNEVTGRQLMQWIGEASCRFCRANADGDIELAWYEASGKTITVSDYYGKGLRYETYQVAPIEAVQVKLADSENGALWPAAQEGANAYVITGNPIFLTQVTDQVGPCLQVIGQILRQVSYTPCQVAIPVDLSLGAGSIVDVLDANGKKITGYVMTKVSTGQRDTLECTGSARRDSAGASNTKSPAEKLRQMELALKSVDGKKVVSLINLSEEGVKIAAKNIQLEGVVTANKNFKILADGSMETIKGKIAGWVVDDNSIRHGDLGAGGSMWLCRTGTSVSPATYGNGGIGDTSAYQTGWSITVGNKFGVLNTGACYASDLHVTGGSIKIKADASGMDDGGYTTVSSAGLCLTSLDYQAGARGCAMKYGTRAIQFEENGNSVPLVWVGYYEDTGGFEKVLQGRWVIEGLVSPTTDDLARRIAVIEDILGY